MTKLNWRKLWSQIICKRNHWIWWNMSNYEEYKNIMTFTKIVAKEHHGFIFITDKCLIWQFKFAQSWACKLVIVLSTSPRGVPPKFLILSTNKQINNSIDGFQCKFDHKLDKMPKKKRMLESYERFLRIEQERVWVHKRCLLHIQKHHHSDLPAWIEIVKPSCLEKEFKS